MKIYKQIFFKKFQNITLKIIRKSQKLIFPQIKLYNIKNKHYSAFITVSLIIYIKLQLDIKFLIIKIID